MIRAVVDTNVLISGLFWEGTPKKCLDKYRFENIYQIIFSPEAIHEFRQKLLYKFRLESTIVNRWVKEITLYAELVIPRYITKICRDAKDNMILDTAKAGRADYIVSGDKDLLVLKVFNKNIKIVSPADFLAVLDRRNISKIEGS